MATKKSAGVAVQVKALNIKTVEVRIRGFDGPLVVHNWNTKAIREMLEKQMLSGKRSTKQKEAKNPEKCFQESLYYIGTGKERKKRYGFPATAFKAAMVRACKLLKDTKQLDLDMIMARQTLFVMPDGQENREINIDLPGNQKVSHAVRTDLVEIFGEPQNRMDMVRVGNGSADIRFRAEFPKWDAKLKVQYNSELLDESTVANIIYRAGMTVGIGEGRPEKGDQGWGRFEIY